MPVILIFPTPKIPVNVPVSLLSPDKQEAKSETFGKISQTIHEQ